ncbi:MAG: autotransporter domain-containing protein [Aphanocapsa feldmannii 288cV]|nr:MAG: autotransporter domain-containing protein [Aphanocapsa feldmannii 288cV]
MPPIHSAISRPIHRHRHGPDAVEAGWPVHGVGSPPLLWAAALAMVFGGGLAGQACVISSETAITCSGDLSSGVKIQVGSGGTYTSLLVTDLSSDIEPDKGVNGIEFTSKGSDIDMSVDTGEFDIKVRSKPNPSSSTKAIYAYVKGDGDITLTAIGNIKTSGYVSRGIYAHTKGDGDIMITAIGNIKTSGNESKAISAYAEGNGNISIKTDNRTTNPDDQITGIFAKAEGDGDITVTTNNRIATSKEYVAGIYTFSTGAGNTTIAANDDIATFKDFSTGILAYAVADGNVRISQFGNMATAGIISDGIVAYTKGNDNSNIRISMNGDITTTGRVSDGIVVYAEDNSTISIELDNSTISAANGHAVRFEGGSENILVTNNDVTISGTGEFRRDGKDYGIDVRGSDGNEKIVNVGTLTSRGRIDLGGGTNAFQNISGATFNSGESLILGEGNQFTNLGNLSPGGDKTVQHTTLTGDFVNKKTGVFTVTLDPTKNATRSDQLIVNGTAYLERGKVQVNGAPYGHSDSYTILQASDGVIGRFYEVVDTMFVDNRLSYTGNSVELTSIWRGLALCHYARTANQRSVCGRFRRNPNNDRFSRQPTALSSGLASSQASGNHHSPGSRLEQAILNQTTEKGLLAAYDDLSGEIHASLKGALVDAGQTTVAAISRRITANAGNVDPYTTTAGFADQSFLDQSFLDDDQNSFWITNYRPSEEIDATANTAQMNTDVGGILLGIDRELNDHWRLGILSGYGQTTVNQAARLSSALVDTWSLGIYGGAEADTSSFSFGTIYSGHSIDTSRSVHIDTFSEHLSASYDAQNWQFFTEAAHQIKTGKLMLEPFAGLSSISLHTEGFSEVGGEEATLTASSDTSRTAFTTLGMRSAIELSDTIQARAMVGWRHGFGDRNPSSSLGLSNSSADRVMGAVTGAPIAEDALVTELGLEAGISGDAVLGLAYSGRFGDGVTNHGFKAALKLKF